VRRRTSVCRARMKPQTANLSILDVLSSRRRPHGLSKDKYSERRANAMYSPEEFLIPQNLDEVLSIIAANPDGSRVVAGNTTMFELASRGLAPDVKILIDISRAGLDRLELRGDELHIGSTVTLAELTNSTILTNDRLYAAIAETAREISPSQVRNVATVGGEICSAISFFDLPAILLALDAEVNIVSKGKQRMLPLRDFYTDFLAIALEPGEIVTEIVLHKPKGKSSAAFIKLGRTASDFALVNVATSLSFDESGNCQTSRIWLGGVGATYHECKASESILVGSKLDEPTVRKAADLAVDFEPSPSIHASSKYKRTIIPALTRNCLHNALGKIRSN